jgi:hypothetical protein
VGYDPPGGIDPLPLCGERYYLTSLPPGAKIITDGLNEENMVFSTGAGLRRKPYFLDGWKLYRL